MHNVATQDAMEDVRRDPGKSSLFFLTLWLRMESVCLAIYEACKQEHSLLGCVRCVLDDP